MDLRSQSTLLAALFCLALAISVFLRPRRRALTLYAAFCLTLFLYYLGEFATVLWSSFWSRVSIATSTLIPVSALAFFLEFLGVSPKHARRAWLAAMLGVPLGITVAVTPLASSEIARTLIALWVFGALLVGFSLLLRRMAVTESSIERARLLYLTGGAGLTLLAAALDRLPEYGIDFPQLGAIVTSLYMFLLAQTLQKLRLLDLNELLGKIAALSLHAIILVAIFVLLVSWVGDRPSLFLFNSLVASIVILILFEPLRAKLEEWVVANLFRERYEMIRSLDFLRSRISNVIEVHDLAKLVMDTLHETRRVTHVSMYLLSEDRPGFFLFDSLGPAPAPFLDAAQARPLIAVAMQGHPAVLLENIERKVADLKYTEEYQTNKRKGREEGKRLNDLKAALKAMNAGIAVPLMSGDRVIGFLNLWDERVPETYASNEIESILKLGEQIATVVENSKLYERMKEKDRLAALGEMAAGLAHEIRNPLGAIKGAAQYLSPENLPAENNEFLQIIVDEVNRLNSVVSHFLDYSRPLKQNFVPVELSNVISRTAKLLSSDLPENVVLQVDGRENLPKVSADAEQLKQVLINLIQNAVQAMPEGGTITLTVRSPDSIPGWRFASAPETVEIRVLDTGNGIPEEARPHIFVPFYTTKEKGTGLGLAICDRIIKSHGGSIMISSRIGEGTEFIIRLPAIPEPRVVVDSNVTSSPAKVNISEIDLTPFPGTLMPPEGARGKKKKKSVQRR